METLRTCQTGCQRGQDCTAGTPGSLLPAPEVGWQRLYLTHSAGCRVTNSQSPVCPVGQQQNPSTKYMPLFPPASFALSFSLSQVKSESHSSMRMPWVCYVLCSKSNLFPVFTGQYVVAEYFIPCNWRIALSDTKFI